MFANFFRAPTYSGGTWSSFQDDIVYTSDRIVSYEYIKRFTKPGSFSLVLPFDSALLSVLEINGTIFLDSDWLFIQHIGYDGRQLTITGKDCKGLLDLRLTTYADQQHPGTQGYDVATGTTAACVKHYLDANAISPTDSSRKLPLVWQNGATGLNADSYMVRLEYLSDVVDKLCTSAEIGYDVTGDMTGSGFKLRLIQGTDRSFGQDAHDRVIFSPAWRSVKVLSFEHGVDDLYNTIYAVDSNEVTKVINRGQAAASGVARRECTVSVGVSSTAPETADYYDKYALEQIEDNVETHSYSVEPSSTGYGTDYALGDKVTVIDSATGNRFDAVIVEATKTYSQGVRAVTVVLGHQKKKPLQRIVNDLIGGVARRR